MANKSKLQNIENKVISKTKKETPAKKINTYTDLRNSGVMLFSDKSMQLIRKQSGPLAPTCEYQVHFHSLVARILFSDRSVLDIAVPTVIFNYKQTVSGARIDFELSDVDEVSEQVEPVTNVKINELLSKDGVMTKIKALFPDNEIQMISTGLNSIHKHPGSSKHQSFSGTDLNTSTTHNTGIVFPLSTAEFKSNFAGIMAHDGEKNNVARFEYRIANGDVVNGNEISYYKGRCVTFVKAEITPAKPEVPSSQAENIFGITVSSPAIKAKQNKYMKLDELTKAQISGSEIMNKIESIWQNSEYEPMTDFIIPTNISKKIYTQTNRAPSWYKGGKENATQKKVKYQCDNDIDIGLFDDQYLGFDSFQDDPFTEEYEEDFDYDKMRLAALEDEEFVDMETMQASTIVELIKILQSLELAYYGDNEKTSVTPSSTKDELIKKCIEIRIELIEEIDYLTIYDETPIRYKGHIMEFSELLEDLKKSFSESRIYSLSYNQAKELSIARYI